MEITVHTPEEEFTTTRIIDGDASAVHVQFTDAYTGQTYNATGSAKRHPKDRPNTLIGGHLATARALRKLADHLEHDAYLEMLFNSEDRWS